MEMVIPTCGLYFLDQSSMRKHHAKKHKISLVNPDGKDYKKRKELDVACAMVDGMPERTCCGKRFDRFSGLRAHFLRTREKFPRASSSNVEVVATSLTPQQPTSQTGDDGGTDALPGHTCREHQSRLPMIKRPEVVNKLPSAKFA